MRSAWRDRCWRRGSWFRKFSDPANLPATRSCRAGSVLTRYGKCSTHSEKLSTATDHLPNWFCPKLLYKCECRCSKLHSGPNPIQYNKPCVLPLSHRNIQSNPRLLRIQRVTTSDSQTQEINVGPYCQRRLLVCPRAYSDPDVFGRSYLDPSGAPVSNSVAVRMNEISSGLMLANISAVQQSFAPILRRFVKAHSRDYPHFQIKRVNPPKHSIGTSSSSQSPER